MELAGGQAQRLAWRKAHAVEHQGHLNPRITGVVPAEFAHGLELAGERTVQGTAGSSTASTITGPCCASATGPPLGCSSMRCS